MRPKRKQMNYSSCSSPLMQTATTTWPLFLLRNYYIRALDLYFIVNLPFFRGKEITNGHLQCQIS